MRSPGAGNAARCAAGALRAAGCRTALVGLVLLAFASCRESAPGTGIGPEPMPGVTAAPTIAGPSESGDAPLDTAPAAEAAGAPELDPTPEGSTVATPDPAGGQADGKPDTLAEYPLQENPLAGCPLCHVDIEDEFVGTLHFEEKVGCITCHGPSEGHLADENNEVKPDEVFARADVNRLCERCHECARPKPEKPELTEDGQRKVCTDCHGSHDLAMAAD